MSPLQYSRTYVTSTHTGRLCSPSSRTSVTAPAVPLLTHSSPPLQSLFSHIRHRPCSPFSRTSVTSTAVLLLAHPSPPLQFLFSHICHRPCSPSTRTSVTSTHPGVSLDVVCPLFIMRWEGRGGDCVTASQRAVFVKRRLIGLQQQGSHRKRLYASD